jgi:CRISPR/Cas system CMR subunit Cmr4 (Cas7 group RAMP superfamily)
MNRQNVPCANLKLNNCQGFVTQRGNILCETCTETRKNNTQNKREFDFDSLMIKYREIESELSKYKSEIEELKQSKNTLTERVTILLGDKKNTEIIQLNNSQLILDNEKLSLDNGQLKILNENLSKQNELLSNQITKFSKMPETQQPEAQTTRVLQVHQPPQTARNRGLTIFSKIPELKTLKRK